MEKVLSEQDRIRKAEEIYLRRKGIKDNSVNINVGTKTKGSRLKKMLIQLLISIFIFLGLYISKTNNILYINETIKNILNYDISTENITESVLQYINKIMNKDVLQSLETDKENEIENNETIENENVIEEINDTVETSSNSLVDEENIENQVVFEEALSIISQEEIDVDYIKNNFTFIKPLEGRITSKFGIRNPTVKTVPVYHTGIDISANVGTPFRAAMEGEVIQVSSTGDYGNHVTIQNGEVTTMYAHCKKIYVSKGDYVNLGEIIGETGNTGNVTGPHLHFEIKRNGNLVNPDDIIDFYS